MKVPKFITVTEQEYEELIEVLKDRLPRSGNVYNSAMIMKHFPGDVCAYKFSQDDDQLNNATIMIICRREDYGQDISFSVPDNFEVSKDLRHALCNCEFIDWRGKHMFCAVDRRISKLLFDINTTEYSNSIRFNPNYFYYLDFDKALKFSANLALGQEHRQLDEKHVSFFTDLWMYAIKGSEEFIKRILKKCTSSGIFVNNQLVSAALVNPHGLMGILNTPKEHQKKGYGTLCMKFLMKDMAVKGLLPVSSAQVENTISCDFHEQKLGMTRGHLCDYILHIPYKDMA